MVTPFRMGPGTTTAEKPAAAVPPPSSEPKPVEPSPPGQAAELVSASQLGQEEQEQVRQQRAERVLGRPAELAGLDPHQQLEACENLIRRADEQREGTVRDAKNRAAARFIDTAGPYLAWIRDNELYSLDHPGRTFEAYMWDVWGYKGAQAYALMDGVTVRAALGLAGTEEYAIDGVVVTTKHVRAIAPAIRAMRTPTIATKMWDHSAAENGGEVTEASLRESFRVLSTPALETPQAESNTSFDSSARAEESNKHTDAERWRVNEVLRSTEADLERILQRLEDLVNAGVAPLESAAAARAVAQIQAAGRRLDRTTVVPVDAEVIEAELVD
jgi:hypothetical protein